MDEHSCVVEDNKYFRDAGKQLFWAIFLIRLLLKPFIEKMVERATLGYCPSKETISRLEGEINDGLETALFVFESVNATPLPYGTAIFMALPAVWPIFGAFYKFKDRHFMRGPKAAYDIYDDKFRRYGFTLMESLYNALSLSSSMSFVLSLLFNVLYNSTHEVPFPYQNQIVWPIISVSALFGASSVLNENAWEAMRFSEVLSNTFFYSFNMAVSSISCIAPESFTDTGFLKTGWIYVVALGILCLGFSVISGYQDTDNPYSNEESDKHKYEVAFDQPGRSGFWRLLQDPDYVSIKTRGFGCAL